MQLPTLPPWLYRRRREQMAGHADLRRRLDYITQGTMSYWHNKIGLTRRQSNDSSEIARLLFLDCGSYAI